MNIETVNELIQSLESAGELSIKETKVMALAKAYQQLAAENVALKASIPPLKMINDVTDSWDDVSLAEEVGFNLAISAIMKNITDTPATDRIVAGIKADGVEMAIKEFFSANTIEASSMKNVLQSFAQQLREGADK
ncbi:hypothetical protein [Klebsiella oxytoca]|uniref:hypothetical protein n=1 Tax=Klebsiella oxytoca TaxID=571 RepID=UPI00298744CE|nr:hypothetical protein [Klebsiella oxytoca]MEB2921553.1 hypothetical protein [Klebsiella oxytoca]HEG4372060.1 hypothetical protein [Klebsiella oxytoca]